MTFLDLNGYDFIEDETAIENMFVDTASGIIEQEEFFGWVMNHSRHRGGELGESDADVTGRQKRVDNF